MTRIGLLSDTHGFLDPQVFTHFRECDEIWHAGDIGDAQVADSLENFKPLRAVYGNIDDLTLRARYPEHQRFVCEGLSVWITHIGGAPPNYNSQIRKILLAQPPDIFICGHSHILRLKRDASLNQMLYLNPGAAGNHGFHLVKTLLRFTLQAGKIENLEAIELGKRGQV
ncbi:MAG: metallophosphoesterase family protein [Cyclobacteriaceae bacterium]|jgi:putative phosphoesterase|nr:metallophosphatase family protein [Flammeovirgaceae bacterium]